MNKTPDAKLKAQREYAKRSGYAASIRSNKKNTKMYALRVSYNVDPDIIAELEKQENVSAYLKRLIREEIKKNQKNI